MITVASFDCIRWELVDGLRIIVIRRPFSGEGGELFDLWFGDEIFKNDDRFVFGLFPGTRDDVDEVDDGVGDTDLIVAESGESRWDVDCARDRRLK